jgi:hypothetical protein
MVDEHQSRAEPRPCSLCTASSWGANFVPHPTAPHAPSAPLPPPKAGVPSPPPAPYLAQRLVVLVAHLAQVTGLPGAHKGGGGLVGQLQGVDAQPTACLDGTRAGGDELPLCDMGICIRPTTRHYGLHKKRQWRDTGCVEPRAHSRGWGGGRGSGGGCWSAKGRHTGQNAG